MVAQNEIAFVGVDGCPYGWFSVGFSPDGHWVTNAFPTFTELLAHYAGAELILVDIPIGLPDGPEERRCDPQARELLNQAAHNLGSRVFRTPTRAAVEYLARRLCYRDVVDGVHCELTEAIQGEFGRDVQPNIAQDVQRETIKAVRHAITKAIQREITGGSLPIQTLEITFKIAEVDNLLPRNAAPYIREIHPEICFWALTGGNPIVPKKDTQSGMAARIAALNGVEVPAQEIFDNALARFPRGQVRNDDILDALAAAVTAYRGSLNEFQTLPEPHRRNEQNLPTRDATNDLAMEMVYWRP